MNFRTRIDFTNRQAKQYEKTDISLSGSSIFGLPYTSLTSGPDLSFSGITYEDAALQSTYSGNTGTTVYTFSDSRMTIDEGDLVPITPSNSGTTQYAGPTWAGYDMFTTLDGYTGWTYYSAVTYDIVVVSMVDLGGGAYSGIVQSDFIAYSATSLDYSGRTIWVDVSGITRTEDLIVSNTPVIGYVLTCYDTEGKATWQPSSGATTGATIWTAGTGANSAVLAGSGGFAGIWAVSEGFQSVANGRYSHAEGYKSTTSGEGSHSEGGTSSSPLGAVSGGSASGNGSHAEGGVTIASGLFSHAEGYSTTATTSYSHAEGTATIASGSVSHAEGDGSRATGSTSHAEGYQTIAGGTFSHAQGYQTIASGSASHASGSGTTASGTGSHAGGSGTTASGNNSYAGGNNSIASGLASFVHSTNSIASGDRTVVLGGQNITGATSDMVYVPDLIIDGLTSTDPIATDSDGKIVAGASDARLKTKITDLTSALEKVLKLRGVSYEWTEESKMGAGVTKFGLIAQEVNEVIPEMVRERSKGDGMLSLSYTEIIPFIIEAIKELASQTATTKYNSIIETQIIASEDNNIELNYNGNHDSAIGGGITVLNAVSDGVNSEIKTDKDGNWIITPPLSTNKLTLPEYTPNSTEDKIGSSGDMVWDDKYLYIKTNGGWKRSSLENF